MWLGSCISVAVALVCFCSSDLTSSLRCPYAVVVAPKCKKKKKKKFYFIYIYIYSNKIERHSSHEGQNNSVLRIQPMKRDRENSSMDLQVNREIIRVSLLYKMT